MNTPRSLRCRTVAGGHFRQRSHIRDLPALVIDEPSGIADSDPAPQPLEILLAALGADLAIGIRTLAVMCGLSVSSLVLEVEASTAIAPGSAGPPFAPGLEEISVAVLIEADAPQEVLAALVSRATLRSPVANTLHDGTQLSVALAKP